MKAKIFAVFAGLAFFASAEAQAVKPQILKDGLNNSSLTKLPPETNSSKNTENAKNSEKPTETKTSQTNAAYQRPDAERRFKRYVNGVVGPLALLRTATTAGISTARNSPEEWGKNWEGFGRRFASNLGRSAIRGTTVYALDEALQLDSAFYRSNKKDFGSRFSNALLSTVTARRPSGKRALGVPRLVGTYTASVVAYETWYPRRYDYKDGLRSGTISLGFNAAFNLIREFIWKK
jgi:hypothetical protein